MRQVAGAARLYAGRLRARIAQIAAAEAAAGRGKDAVRPPSARSSSEGESTGSAQGEAAAGDGGQVVSLSQRQARRQRAHEPSVQQALETPASSGT